MSNCELCTTSNSELNTTSKSSKRIAPHTRDTHTICYGNTVFESIIGFIADVSEMLPLAIFNMESGGLILYQLGHLLSHFAVMMETNYLRAKFHTIPSPKTGKTLVFEHRKHLKSPVSCCH
jgi:hypothetical protein